MSDKFVFPHDVARVVKALCLNHPGAVADTALRCIETNDFASIVRYPCNPDDYDSGLKYKFDSAIIGTFKKCSNLPGLPSESQLEEEAISLFYTIERTNFSTNLRLLPYLYGLSDQSEGVREIISRARKWLANVLSRVPPSLEGRFGPGSTYGDSGFLSTLPDKINNRATLTSGIQCLTTMWWETAWGRACLEDSRHPSLVRGNRFTTVPKDSSKRRGICIEPSINVFYQLAVGTLLKKKILRATGWDISEAQEHHRKLACKASSDGSLFTMDLSNASDTVSYHLVKLLLPDLWFELLDTLRSPFTKVRGKWVKLEKFSSMGNGYTFELETLIFSSLIHAVTGLEFGKDFFVYGDDIIAPTEFYDDVAAMMRFFGFSVNQSKSFRNGPFRESCGGDYFGGVDVRPHFLKELPREPIDFIKWANGVTRMAGHDGFNSYCGQHFRLAWYRILDNIPSSVRRIRGPRSLGDLVIHDDDKSTWKIKVRPEDWQQRLIEVWMPRLLSERVAWKHFSPGSVLASALYGCEGGASGVIPRKPLYSYTRAYTTFLGS